MKACIFDLDGTLTDTLDSLEYSVNETMKQIHMPQITKEQCRDFVGNGAKVLIEKALKAGGDEALDKLDEAMEVYGRAVSYTHLRAHETDSYLVCRLLLEKKKNIVKRNLLQLHETSVLSLSLDFTKNNCTVFIQTESKY